VAEVNLGNTGNPMGNARHAMGETAVSMERIRRAILLLRGQKVRLDRDLAMLYGVATKVLKQAVKRNIARFPEDFMFVLSHQEFMEWRSQIVTSRADRIGLRHQPMAFSEQGIAMLSSLLNSERAIQVNIAIMRAFVQLRRLLASHEDLARKLAELERKYDAQFRVVFDAIRPLMAPSEKSRRSIGPVVSPVERFRVEEGRPAYGRRQRKQISKA